MDFLSFVVGLTLMTKAQLYSAAVSRPIFTDPILTHMHAFSSRCTDVKREDSVLNHAVFKSMI